MKKAVLSIIYFTFLMLTACDKDSSTPSTGNNGDGGNNNPIPPKEIVETMPAVLSVVNKSVGTNCNGFYQAVPVGYNATTTKYPLLIFLHGQGELGNGTTDLSKVLNNGTPSILKKKAFPPNFEIKGKNYSFIVLMPQFTKWPSADDVQAMIDYAVQTYSIDKTRIYVAGLSMGGGVTWMHASKYAPKVAAIVTMAGAAKLSDANAKEIVTSKLPVWSFHNQDDKTVDVSYTINNIAKLNSYSPVIAPKVTYWPTGGHDSWTKPSDPAYKENGINIYEWMLQYSR